MLDAVVKNLLEQALQSGVPALNELPVAAAREQYLLTGTTLGGDMITVGEVIDTTLPGPMGQIPVRIYRPLGATESDCLPALIYFHGGGWVIGDLDSHDHVCRALCKASASLVISVAYRLAPEHRFPAAVDDALAATLWIADNAAQWGIDSQRLAIGGDSAGGNLAAVVTHQLRDPAINVNNVKLKFQLLIYPVTDMTLSFPSISAYAEGYRLTRPLIEWFVGHYMGEHHDRTDTRASPILARDLRKLPPALVITAEFDPLCDEGQAYADKLRAAGVAVDYQCYDGMIHGFVTMSGVLDQAQQALQQAGQAVQQALQ